MEKLGKQGLGQPTDQESYGKPALIHVSRIHEVRRYLARIRVKRDIDQHPDIRSPITTYPRSTAIICQQDKVGKTRSIQRFFSKNCYMMINFTQAGI